MDYMELSIPIADSEQAEIATAFLADYPFDSFEQTAGALKAYAPVQAIAAYKAAVDDMLSGMGITGQRWIMIEAVNWNAVWESNFDPVDVDGRWLIRAPFHKPAPEGSAEVVIMPKMSFGTGHHATTWLMVRSLLDMDVRGLQGLDMGSGTGVLAIIAAKCGAEHVDAVDIDQWAFENCAENATSNGVEGLVTPILGDVGAIAERRYDFILANININILLADMAAYAATLAAGGRILLSGIFESDIPALSARAAEAGFSITGSHVREGWACVTVAKN